MTFEPHPIKVLYPEKHLHRIFDIDDQVEQLKILGIDMLVIEPFSREFSQLAPERFLKEWLIEPFHPTAIVVGYDFSFGAGRKGSIDFLEHQAGPSSYALEVVPPVKVSDIVVSSTRIRQALMEGDVSLTARLLGRNFYIKGLVEKGAGRGRKIGIPTANLHSSAETVPARGVYAAWAEFGGKRWKAAMNIGVNPTFTQGQTPSPTIEAHVLGFPHETDLYGENIRLEFVQRLRDERRFDGFEALVAQIHSDIKMAEGCLEQDRQRGDA